jgi:hypothetical protein
MPAHGGPADGTHCKNPGAYTAHPSLALIVLGMGLVLRAVAPEFFESFENSPG